MPGVFAYSTIDPGQLGSATRDALACPCLTAPHGHHLVSVRTLISGPASGIFTAWLQLCIRKDAFSAACNDWLRCDCVLALAFTNPSTPQGELRRAAHDADDARHQHPVLHVAVRAAHDQPRPPGPGLVRLELQLSNPLFFEKAKPIWGSLGWKTRPSKNDFYGSSL